MLEIIKQRHSVRQYDDREIEKEKKEVLLDLVEKSNQKNGLNFQICFDEPEAFDTFMAHYGKFSGVKKLCRIGFGKGKG